MLPTEDMLEDSVLPVFKQWTPPEILKGGNWKDAYRKAPGNKITFADGSTLAFYTYKQDPAVLAGWSGDYIVWDEPPPEGHWRESAIRTMDRKGCHRFGMTPVNMVGGGIGWIKRTIWDRAKPDHPNHNPRIHIVRASIWDNPDYTDEQIEEILAEYPADERQAREFGDFIHFGGMVYANGFHNIKREPLEPDQLKGNQIVCGIDPGVRNAAFVWVSFDRDNIAVAFDEVKLQEKTVLEYVQTIRRINSKWELKKPPIYVIDPSARNRHGINLENIEGELQRQGVFCVRGYNPVEAGIQSIRRRILEGGFFVTENCKGLFDEADEYRMEDEEEFKVVKENDHRLDALRYALMFRPWYPRKAGRHTPPDRWIPGTAPSFDWFHHRGER